MNSKLQDRAFGLVADRLQPGEEPQVAVRALVGKLDASRFGTVVRRGAVAGLAGAAGAAVDAAVTAGGKQFVVVTDQRVFFLSQTFLGGPGKKVIGVMPRDEVTLADTKFGTVSVVRLAFVSGGGISLTFPRIDQAAAKQIAAAF